MKLSLKAISQAVLILVMLSLSLATVALLRQASFFGWQLMIVKSGSMSPAIPTGSMIAVKPQPAYTVGDVISFRDATAGQALITHRIAERATVNGTLVYYTKGDANAIEDLSPVMHSDLLGKVGWSVPWIGYLFAFLQTPLGVMAFIVVPGTILIYEELKKLHGNIQTMLKPASVLVIAVTLASLLGGIHSTWAMYVTQTQVQGVSFSTTRWLMPELQAAVLENRVTSKVIHVSGVTEVQYRISYQHLVEGQAISEAVVGTLPKPAADQEFTLPETYLGTCSADEVCTPHASVTQLQVEVLLIEAGQADTSLIKIL